jgi:hypothetical protein
MDRCDLALPARADCAIGMASRVAQPIARRSAYPQRMDLDGLLALHGVGPKAVRPLQQARAD